MTKPPNPFRNFNSSPEVIRLVLMMYVKYPLSLHNVEVGGTAYSCDASGNTRA